MRACRIARQITGTTAVRVVRIPVVPTIVRPGSALTAALIIARLVARRIPATTGATDVRISAARTIVPQDSAVTSALIIARLVGRQITATAEVRVVRILATSRIVPPGSALRAALIIAHRVAHRPGRGVARPMATRAAVTAVPIPAARMIAPQASDSERPGPARREPRPATARKAAPIIARQVARRVVLRVARQIGNQIGNQIGATTAVRLGSPPGKPGLAAHDLAPLVPKEVPADERPAGVGACSGIHK